MDTSADDDDVGERENGRWAVDCGNGMGDDEQCDDSGGVDGGNGMGNAEQWNDSECVDGGKLDDETLEHVVEILVNTCPLLKRVIISLKDCLRVTLCFCKATANAYDMVYFFDLKKTFKLQKKNFSTRTNIGVFRKCVVNILFRL